MPRRVGPYRALERVGHVAYCLSLPAKLKMHPVLHISLLKPWQESGRSQPPPLRLLLDGQLVWTVDHILDHRNGVHENLKEFLIRWEGYDKTNDSWEPEAHIHDPKLVQDYWDCAALRAQHMQQQAEQNQ